MHYIIEKYMIDFEYLYCQDCYYKILLVVLSSLKFTGTIRGSRI